MSNPHRKVSAERSHELVQIYLHMGTVIAERECMESGLSRHYARNVAVQLGHRRPRKSGPRQNANYRIDHNDPRWQWAVERGPVVI